MNSGIYKITNKINNKSYIGSSINFKRRISKHKTKLKKINHINKHLQRSYNKHGIDNFSFEILEIVSNKEDLFRIEQYYLDWLDPEYNICKTAGSWFGNKHSEETKKKISKSKKGKPVPKYVTDYLKMININNKYWLGKKHKESSKKKISSANKGNKNGMYGKSGSLSPTSKPILQYDLDMNFIKEWESAAEAGRKLKIHHSNISKCCKHKEKHIFSGGFKWRYKNE